MRTPSAGNAKTEKGWGPWVWGTQQAVDERSPEDEASSSRASPGTATPLPPALHTCLCRPEKTPRGSPRYFRQRDATGREARPGGQNLHPRPRPLPPFFLSTVTHARVCPPPPLPELSFAIASSWWCHCSFFPTISLFGSLKRGGCGVGVVRVRRGEGSHGEGTSVLVLVGAGWANFVSSWLSPATRTRRAVCHRPLGLCWMDGRGDRDGNRTASGID